MAGTLQATLRIHKVNMYVNNPNFVCSAGICIYKCILSSVKYVFVYYYACVCVYIDACAYACTHVCVWS